MTMSVWNFISRNEQMHYCDEAFPPFVITSIAVVEEVMKIQKSENEQMDHFFTPYSFI